MNSQEAEALIDRYLQGRATKAEEALVQYWVVKESVKGGAQDNAEYNEHAEMWAVINQNINTSNPAQPPRFRKTYRIAVAVAAAIAVMITGVWFYTNNLASVTSDDVAYKNDITPGKNGATLTLANGQQIFINDALAGNIATQSGVKISKDKDGQIIYEVTSIASPRRDSDGREVVEYNTLTTTRGEQTQVRLPDGSLVFLNAVSSLRYPTNFAKSNERRLSLAGEGYFEVAKDKDHPFIVESRGQQVEVLGTHFNISAYVDEPVIKTTLVEGSVRVTANHQSTTLKPNQQASFNGTYAIQVADVEAEYEVAWKKGFFLFNGDRLESIMTKIARWYNVEVEYTDPALKSKTFIGTISRFEKVSKVLNMLERTEVASFKIDGSKIIIAQKE